MLDPKSGEHLKLAVVHRDRNVHDQLAVGILQDLPETFVQVKFLRRKVEARRLRLPGIDFLFEGNSFHRISRYECSHLARSETEPAGKPINLRQREAGRQAGGTGRGRLLISNHHRDLARVPNWNLNSCRKRCWKRDSKVSL